MDWLSSGQEISDRFPEWKLEIETTLGALFQVDMLILGHPTVELTGPLKQIFLVAG